MPVTDLTPKAKWLLLKSKRRFWAEVCRRFYRDTTRDLSRAMVLAGAARSGTTWLAEIIGRQLACRIMDEPFHPRRVTAFRSFPDFVYRRPCDQDPELYAFVRKILEGSIRDPWIDRNVGQILPSCRLIKTIRAALFLRWIRDAFPDVPLLLLIRHPCAVVLSRLEAGWSADEDLTAFLSQEKLVEDHLKNQLDLMRASRDAEQGHAIVWCVQHLVLKSQFRKGNLPVVFYERLCLEPRTEIDVVFRALGRPYQASVFKQLDQPSRTTTRSSAPLTGQNRVHRWRKVLSRHQIQRILETVDAFGLTYLYGDTCTPQSNGLWPGSDPGNRCLTSKARS